MSSILFEAVGFHYDSPYAPVFERLDLDIDTAWKTGVVGRNGRGKTTLLRLVSRALEPRRGRVSVPIETAYFPTVGGSGEATTLAVVRESVAPFARWERRMEELLDAGDEESLAAYGALAERFERRGGYTIDERIECEFARMEMGPALLRRRFETLSGGERTRALVVSLFLRDRVFALIDEPTNHLDAQGRALLGRYLAGKRSFLLVSHDRYLLDGCVDHIVSLEKADARVSAGSFSSWKAQREREEESERRRRAKLERELKALTRAARERRVWSGRKERQKRGAGDKGFVGSRAARQMKRALAIERRAERKLEEKRALLCNREKERSLKLAPQGPSPEVLAALDNVCVRFGDREVLREVSLRVRRGDCIAIEGPNGCGKTTLLRILAGELAPTRGRLALSPHLTVVRAHQLPRWHRGPLREHLEREGIDEAHFRGVMGVLGVEGAVFERPLETMSEGERKKVDLCRSFLGSSHLLLWDEPLNYLDIASREQIEEVLLAYAPTLVFVEHDRWFVERIATARLDLGRGIRG